MIDSPQVINSTTIEYVVKRARRKALSAFSKDLRFSAASVFMREIVTNGLEHGFRDPGRAFKWLAKVATEEGFERFVTEMDNAEKILKQNLLQTV